MPVDVSLRNGRSRASTRKNRLFAIIMDIPPNRLRTGHFVARGPERTKGLGDLVPRIIIRLSLNPTPEEAIGAWRRVAFALFPLLVTERDSVVSGRDFSFGQRSRGSGYLLIIANEGKRTRVCRAGGGLIKKR